MNQETNLVKQKRGVPIGTKKSFGGREYIKTASGWKYHGKGNGKKAQEHVSSIESRTESENKNFKKKESKEEKQIDKLQQYASNTSTEDLKNFASNENKDKELREVAKRELENRNDSQTSFNQNKEDITSDEKDQVKENGLPNEISVEQSDILTEKNGPAKLNEKTEGYSVKQDDSLISSTDKEEKENDINHKFDAFGRFAAGVIKGRMKSLIAYGSGGVGKTYTVTTELEKAGKKIFDPELYDPGDDGYDYVKITGKMTAAAVYRLMYEHNGKILVFDDCDSVLQDENAINLFKGGLDTSGDGTIDWGSANKLRDSKGIKIPSKFQFTGRAIFISNLDVGKDDKGRFQNEQLQPIISRGYGINLTMNAEQTMDRIRHIATSKDGKLTNLKFPGIPDYTHEDMKSVLNYMNKHKDSASDLNVRTVGTLLAIKKDADEVGVPWERDAKYVYLRKSNSPDIYNGGIFNKRRNQIEKALGRDSRTIEEKKIDWCSMKKSFFKGKVCSKDFV